MLVRTRAFCLRVSKGVMKTRRMEVKMMFLRISQRDQFQASIFSISLPRFACSSFTFACVNASLRNRPKEETRKTA